MYANIKPSVKCLCETPENNVHAYASAVQNTMNYYLCIQRDVVDSYPQQPDEIPAIPLCRFLDHAGSTYPNN
jgi:hypothetical protein